MTLPTIERVQVVGLEPYVDQLRDLTTLLVAVLLVSLVLASAAVIWLVVWAVTRRRSDYLT